MRFLHRDEPAEGQREPGVDEHRTARRRDHRYRLSRQAERFTCVREPGKAANSPSERLARERLPLRDAARLPVERELAPELRLSAVAAIDGENDRRREWRRAGGG